MDSSSRASTTTVGAPRAQAFSAARNPASRHPPAQTVATAWQTKKWSSCGAGAPRSVRARACASRPTCGAPSGKRAEIFTGVLFQAGQRGAARSGASAHTERAARAGLRPADRLLLRSEVLRPADSGRAGRPPAACTCAAHVLLCLRRVQDDPTLFDVNIGAQRTHAQRRPGLTLAGR
jgi:hypothetical protein